jgi:cytidylate kinase
VAIITIYQGASGSGEELAEAVAQSLGYGCISREVLVEASLRYGIPEAKLNEITEKEPNWWHRFMGDLKPYRLALQAAFCELIDDNGIVYHGHLGHELMPHFKHVIKVLLTAPMEMRIQQIRDRHKLNAAAARRYVEEVDKARSRRLMALFSVDWRDPSRFDLVVNLGRMGLEAAKHLIVEMAHLPDYQMNPAAKQAFLDFSLATRVHAALLLSSDMPKSRFDVKVTEGQVAVSGTIPDWISEDRVLAKIKQIPGVKGVESQLVNVPEMGLTD